MSKVLAVFVAAALLFGSVSLAMGEDSVGEVCRDGARLRAGGSMVHHTVASLAVGTKVAVVKQLGDWYVVRIPKDVPVYVSAKWIRSEGEDSGVVAGDRVNLRATPSTKHSALGVTYRGTVVKILGKRDGFLKIVPPDSAVGWVYKSGLKRLAGSVEEHQVNEPAYRKVEKETEEKKASTESVHKAEYLLDASITAFFAGDDGQAETILDKITASYADTPAAVKAGVLLEAIEKRKQAKRADLAKRQARERKRQEIDRKFYEDLKKMYLEELEKIKPKKPVYTATGILKGLGMMVLRRGTHKLIDAEGHELYTLRVSEKADVDLYDSRYYEKKIGVIGKVLSAPGWSSRIIEVEKIVLLETKKK